MSRALVIAMVMVGCAPVRVPVPVVPAPAAPDVAAAAVRIRIAQAERRAAVDELIALAAATTPGVAARALALRGLGRVGGARAVTALVAALGDREPRIASAAAAALGLAAAVDRTPVDRQAAVSDALVGALGAGTSAGGADAAIVEALGRAGAATTQRAIAARLTGPTDVAIAAATALGRFGRRKLALDPETRAALAATQLAGDPRVVAAAVWALSREVVAPTAAGAAPQAAIDDTDPVIAALVRSLAPSAGSPRALAIAGLARHAAVATARAQIVAALDDADWRVAVEAARALTGPAADDAGRRAVVAALARALAAVEHGNAPAAHVVIEALTALADGSSPGVRASAFAAVHDDRGLASLPPLTRGWFVCLAEVVRAGAAATGDPFAAVAGCSSELPDHLRLPLLGALVAAKRGSPAARAHAVADLLASSDPRIRAAGLGAIAALWPVAPPGVRADALAAVVAALAVADPVIAGSAVDAVTALYPLLAAPERGGLATALIARADREPEPELASALLDAIGKLALAAGADACRHALTGHPVRATAAVACLTALHQPALAAPPADDSAPPVDVAAVIGHAVRWHLDTTRGPIDIALRPDVAPWAVATIVALTRRGFYDGLEFHRVVADFVVQGGDPTNSGAGGPGFTIPAEPASASDGPGFTTGGVGIADAGPASGGSQYFIMHSAAPHLDGRYTWCGSVTSGQPTADALLIGDQVLHATVSIH